VAGTSLSLGLATPLESTTDPAPAEGARALVVDGLDTSVFNDRFLELLKTGGVDCVHYSMGDPASFAVLYAFLAARRDRILPAMTVREIRAAQEAGKMSVVFGAQDANLLELKVSKDPTGTYDQIVAALKVYYDLGLRIHGLCYNVVNVFGGGCVEPRVPLTRAGRRLVEEIHRSKIVLDVGGHTGEQTSLDALAISAGVPVICSHTNAGGLNPNLRAISDRVAEGIARTGGVVGITSISDFQIRNGNNYRAHGSRSPQATLEVQLDQYDYFKRLIGVDHIGLGPDFVFGWGETFDHKAESSVTFPPEVLSNGAPAMTTKGFENISELPNLIRGLRGRGWNQAELDQVLGENWLRVYAQVWGA
jgi:membrane dipeptidase